MPRYYYGIFIAETKLETYKIRVKPENLHGQYVTEIEIELPVGLPAHNRSEWQKRTGTSILPPKPKEMCIKVDGEELKIYYFTERQQND